MLWQGENRAQGNEVARFYQQLSHFHKLSFRRMFHPKLSVSDPGGPAALEMMKRLTAQGVTLDVLASIHTVKARTCANRPQPKCFGDQHQYKQQPASYHRKTSGNPWERLPGAIQRLL